MWAMKENKEGLELLKIAKAKAKAGNTEQVDRKQTYNMGTGRRSVLTCIGQSSKFVKVDPFNSQVSKPQHNEEVSWKGVKRVVESFTLFCDEVRFPKTARFEAMQELTHIANEHDDDTIVKRSFVTFTDKDMVLAGERNQPLCVAAKINGFDFQLAMMDNGSFVNMIPLSTFKAARIPAKSLVPEILGILGVTGLGKTLGHVTVDLQVGPIRSKTRFYVMDTKLSFHILLGRPWIHEFEGVASTYHQCFKGKYQGKEVVIKASQAPFESWVLCGDNSKEGATVGLQMKGE